MAAPDLVLFHAGSFGPALERAIHRFSRRWPGVSVTMEGAGARRVARWVCDDRRPCDLVASADDSVIDDFLRPDYVGFNLKVARNRMVLGYRPTSRYADRIHQDNWMEVLQRPDVRLGHTDPEDDPGGYRAQLCWQLAELYYRQPGLARTLAARVSPERVFRTRQQIEDAYASGRLDYCFGYESRALGGDHPWISLPREINLSDPDLAEAYGRARVELSGRAPGSRMTVVGRPIVYSLAIPLEAPHPEWAAEFLHCWLEPGPSVFASAGLIPLPRPQVSEADLPALPPTLRSLVDVTPQEVFA